MSALDELPTRAAAAFLRTALIVDDRAYQPIAADAIPQASLGDDSMPDLPPDLTSSDDEEVETNTFDAQQVVEGFADVGINCAVLAPKLRRDAAENIRILELARRADIVVLDWILSPGGGSSSRDSSTSLGLVEDILKDDAEHGSRLRLICIYTGDRRLREILDAISTRLSKLPEMGSITANPARNAVTVGGAKIVMIAKATGSPVPGIETVDFQSLPSKVVEEFTEHAASGILPQLALSAVGAVRDGVYRLLSRFSAELDPALLSHRSSTTSLDTEQFILSLLGDELAALVGSESVSDSMSDESIVTTVDKHMDSRIHPYVYVKKSIGAELVEVGKEDFKNAMTLGLDKGKIRNGSGHAKKLDQGSGTTSLMLDVPKSELRAATLDVDLRFSALSSLARDRAFDGAKLSPPDLHLGTIITMPAIRARTSVTDETPRYFLCLQPICDSVRLKGKSRFPFLPLLAVEGDARFNMVARGESEYLQLSIGKGKFNTVQYFTFEANPKTSMVVSKWDGAWNFRTTSGVTAEWLGDLRLDKAHKLIGSIVMDAGRIGINEYEYLRDSGE